MTDSPVRPIDRQYGVITGIGLGASVTGDCVPAQPPTS